VALTGSLSLIQGPTGGGKSRTAPGIDSSSARTIDGAADESETVQATFLDAPVLRTDRLTLRGHSIDDFAKSAALWADPDVVRHIGGKPSTREESWSRLLRYAGLWRLLGFGYWVVEETSTGRFVGEVGVADFGREIEPSLSGAPEAGWALATWCHGRGFGTEVVSAVLAWLDSHPDHRRSVCMISPENVASVRLAEKVGFRQFAEASYRGNQVHVFERISDARREQAVGY
jgi:RimJ/RimL family protein N-acetyltransferase